MASLKKGVAAAETLCLRLPRSLDHPLSVRMIFEDGFVMHSLPTLRILRDQGIIRCKDRRYEKRFLI